MIRGVSLRLIIFLLSVHSGKSQPEGNANPYAVATFECAGIYWKTVEDGFGKIRYKAQDSNSWNEGLDLVYDARDGEYRGSIIKLIPNTRYQVELSNNTEKTKLAFKTRNDDFPIGKISTIPEGESDQPLLITESGTPDAYHLIEVPAESKSVLNMKNVYDHGIEIDAD